ncbi:MAG: endolytic transglycosylase MltG [bacterium]
MRWLIRVALICLVLAAAAALYARQRMQALDRPLSPAGGVATFEIPPGAGFKQIVARLHDAGIVQDPLVFELYGRYRGAGTRIKAGRYEVDLGQTPRELLAALQKGTLAPSVRLTIPEGWNRWQIADQLASLGLADREAFLARVERDDLEGRLFPDTYDLHPETPLDVLIGKLTARFDAVWADVLAATPPQRHPATPAALRERLILASLIEKEARTERDRRLVSRVFHNRLAQGMRLQTDPTCVYDARHYRQLPHPRYCRDPENRYSTYVIDGLPPGPIANPGRAALAAALSPATEPEAAKLLYFVARRDGTGEHHFSETYAEHQRAVRRHLGAGDAPPTRSNR